MSRIAKKLPTRRLNLEMTETVRQKLETLRDQTQADSLTEVIRRALAVYDFLHSEKKKGNHLMVKDHAGAEREVVLL